jgi:hypothetical protein
MPPRRCRRWGGAWQAEATPFPRAARACNERERGREREGKGERQSDKGRDEDRGRGRGRSWPPCSVSPRALRGAEAVKRRRRGAPRRHRRVRPSLQPPLSPLLPPATASNRAEPRKSVGCAGDACAQTRRMRSTTSTHALNHLDACAQPPRCMHSTAMHALKLDACAQPRCMHSTAPAPRA